MTDNESRQYGHYRTGGDIESIPKTDNRINYLFVIPCFQIAKC